MKIVVLISLLLTLCSSYSLAAYQLIDKVAAIVDEDVIMESDIERRSNEIKIQMKQAGASVPPRHILRKQIIERLILESVQTQLASRGGIRINDDDVNEAITNIAKQNGMDIQQFVTHLQSQGLNYEIVRESIRDELMINQLRQRQIAQRIRITDQDVDRFLKSEIGREQLASSYRLGHIFIAYNSINDLQSVEAAKKKLAQVEKSLEKQSFSQTAITYSEAPSALEGGDLGWKKAAQLPSLFADTAVELQVGQVSSAIKAGNGFHILKLIDKKGGQQHLVKQYRVRHILVKPTTILSREQARAKLQNLREQITQNNLDFAEAAKENSDDPGSGSRGGDLDWVTPGQMVPAFDKVMLNIAPNQVSPIFSSQFGWHILQVTDTREQDMSQEFREIQAKNALHKRKYEEELDLWLQKIRQEAYVEIKEE